MATGMLQQRSDCRVAPPFVREVGAGPGVVCLHANASTSEQWRGLLAMRRERLQIEDHGDVCRDLQSPIRPERLAALAIG